MTNNDPIDDACEPGGLTRRGFIKGGLAALGGLAAARLVGASALWGADAASAPTTTSAPTALPAGGKAKSVILLWMNGGPPHTDTFDPKPDSGEPYCGPFRKALDTNVPGIRIGTLLPSLAQQADKMAIVRSMTHKNDGHETATYLMQTGTSPSKDLCYPAMGAVIVYKRQQLRQYTGLLPPYISLETSLGRFSEAGFLGSDYQTFATGGDPSAKEFAVQGLVLPKSATTQRVAERRAMLDAVDGNTAETKSDPELAALAEHRRNAYELMLGEAPRVFDLSNEKDDLRDKYGRNRFGQSCLVARRLVEAGVPFITVNHGGWDTHKEHFQAMNRMLPVLDGGFAALLDDLSQRGLLDSTLVIWMGEFGRTPKVAKEPPWNGGRHHFGAVFSVVLAGGGIKGGQVVGASDATGEAVKDRPVYPWDLAATVYHVTGVDARGTLPDGQGGFAPILPPLPAGAKQGGILSEIL